MSTSTPSGSSGASNAKDKAKDAAAEAANQGQQVAQHAASNAKDVASSAQEGVHEVAGQAREQASQLTHQATDQIRTLATQATSQVSEQATAQADKAAQSLRSVSEQMKALAEGRTDEAGNIGQYAQQASDKIAQFASRLEEGGLSAVGQDVSTFARRRPGAFLLGAGVLGFAAGRVLRGAQAAKNMPTSSGAGQSSGQAAEGHLDVPAHPHVGDTIDLTAPAYIPAEEFTQSGGR